MVDGTSWKHVGASGFDAPRLFSAYLHALRWNCVTSTNPRLFQSPFRAGIEVMAYQLEPLRKALRLPRVNLFIADDVGLGKTIEAGFILRELLIRQKVRRLVVAAPPSMLLQWRDELESRFGLTFIIFDREYVAAVRRERGYSVNPWRTHSRFLISHALIRDEAYANLLRDWLDDSVRGSLLILDEAHNAAPASGSRYAIDSMLTRAVRELASHFEHRLFLSATPHNGHPNSFAALLELLDPQRFCRGVSIEDVKRLEPIMVRRLKGDLRDAGIDFPKRRVIEISFEDLAADAPELKLSELLDRYARAREQRIQPESRSVQAASSLIISCLQKRLVSSIEAFYRTLHVHRRAVERALEKVSSAPPPREDQLALLREAPGADDTRAELSADEIGAEEDAEMEAATRATVAGKASQRDLIAAELAMIDEMVAIADQARGRADRRIEHLVGWIRENLCPDMPMTGARWNRRRVLIFTEYLDTKRYIEQQLAAGIAGSDRPEARIASFVGGVYEDREAIKRAFNADPDKYPLRILIATDAAREGVNLQNYCADLFHFDLPWNPSRMEQRNGRIDRKLQREPEVRCHYFVFTQRHEDRVLRALARKTETIQRELGSLSPVLASRLTSRIERGFRRNEADRIIGEIEKENLPEDQRAAVSQELEPIREHKAELNRQLDVLRGLKETSQESIGLREESFRDALCCALELQGAGPLARELDRFDTAQLELSFPEAERRQREADRRHWEHRLRAISGELDAEPARIRASYEVSAHRVEPVGVVYLWPRSG